MPRSVAYLCLLLWTSIAAASVDLEPLGTPSRPHLVRSGTSTTFVMSVHNTATLARDVEVLFDADVALQDGWSGGIALADELFRPVAEAALSLSFQIEAEGSVDVVALLQPSAAMEVGAEGVALVQAYAEGTLQDELVLEARVRNQPKIFYVSIDGCGSDYLKIDRRGRLHDGTYERLMPDSWEFIAGGAWLSDAQALLPSTTDPNHGAAMSGSWPGTQGILSVTRHYLGKNENGGSVTSNGFRELLRHGPDGEPVLTIFDLVKDPAAGGDEGAFSILISGKRWLGDLYDDEERTIDLIAAGDTHPDYVPPPQPYRLGDPVSDPDAASDREGTNLGSRSVKKLISLPAQWAGTNPDKSPEDRWVAEALIRMIAVEDPDLVYANMSECDTAQHIFGAADVPEEWADSGTPGVLWDDLNIYNRNANRDPILDVVYEADQSFGLILEVLEERGVLDGSYVVLLSDHGQTTVMNKDAQLEVGEILAAAGVASSAIERLVTAGELGWIALTESADAPAIEQVLENHQEVHPALEIPVNPFIVINRDEMDSGIDGVEGPLAADGIFDNKKGELYSEWAIDFPVTDNSKVRWPDLFIFNRHHFQNTLLRADSLEDGSIRSLFNGHHASLLSRNVIMVIRGPGVAPGSYAGRVTLADIAPTLYELTGMVPPDNVDGNVLNQILEQPMLRDLGDASDPLYPTLVASGGAEHAGDGTLRLGTLWDKEVEGQPTVAADGDGDDEDGVAFTTALRLNLLPTATDVDVTASNAGKLNGWVDFNADGDWMDPGEHVFADVAVVAGTNALSFTVTPDTPLGCTYARFRLSSASGLSFDGAAADGEVEDYRVEIVPDDDLDLLNLNLSVDQTLFAANSITAGGDFTIFPDLSILAPANVVFHASNLVLFKNGVLVEQGATLSVITGPVPVGCPP